jgi:glyoxylase-like metal-dependent hydrolase (beta-lactamase superfamily II)
MHSHTRRGFLAQTLGAGFLGASLMEQAFFRATVARAAAPGAPIDVFDIEKVADGVYAAIARAPVVVNCNAAIFENANDLLVVDTHSKPSAVAALVAQLRSVTSKPVRWVVETHFHWDHSQGAHAYRQIAPQAQLVSGAATRNLIAEFGAARLKESLEESAKALDGYRQQLAAARSPEQKAHFERMIAGTRAYIDEMQDYLPELPDLTFEDNLVLHDQAHELHLAFRGRGHTSGDVVVFCPQKKVLASGDLLHSWLPSIGDGYPREWPRTLRRIGSFDFTKVIGGHGAVQDSRQRLEQFAGYIEELTERVEAGKRSGQTLEQLQAGITAASLKSLAGEYGEFVGRQMVRYDADAELSRPADVVADNVKGNVEEVWNTLDKV